MKTLPMISTLVGFSTNQAGSNYRISQIGPREISMNFYPVFLTLTRNPLRFGCPDFGKTLYIPTLYILAVAECLRRKIIACE